MTRNEQIASILLEAADLLKNDDKSKSSNKVSLNFFGKTKDVKVVVKDVDKETANKALKSFLSKSSIISKSIESKFCKCANEYNEDPDYTGIPANSIKNYSDIPTLRVSEIHIFMDTRGYFCKNKLILALAGEYTIDEEHGFSLGFNNNKVMTVYRDRIIGSYADVF